MNKYEERLKTNKPEIVSHFVDNIEEEGYIEIGFNVDVQNDEGDWIGDYENVVEDLLEEIGLGFDGATMDWRDSRTVWMRPVIDYID